MPIITKKQTTHYPNGSKVSLETPVFGRKYTNCNTPDGCPALMYCTDEVLNPAGCTIDACGTCDNGQYKYNNYIPENNIFYQEPDDCPVSYEDTIDVGDVILTDKKPLDGTEGDMVLINGGVDFLLQVGDGLILNGIQDPDIDGVQITNNGIRSIQITNPVESPVTTINTNTPKDPVFHINIDYNKLVNEGSLVRKVRFNGREYNPVNGVITFSGVSDPLEDIEVQDGSIQVFNSRPGVKLLSVTGLKINDDPVSKDNSGFLANFKEGNHISFNKTGSEIIVDTKNIVTSINGQTGDVSIEGGSASGGVKYGARTLTSADITALNNDGLEMNSLLASFGDNPAFNSGQKMKLFLDNNLLPLNRYSIIGTKVRLNSGISVTSGQLLSWDIS